MAVTATYAASELVTLIMNFIGGVLAGMAQDQNPNLLGSTMVIIIVIGLLIYLVHKVLGFVGGMKKHAEPRG